MGEPAARLTAAFPLHLASFAVNVDDLALPLLALACFDAHARCRLAITVPLRMVASAQTGKGFEFHYM
jgi:hypothetical protein